MRLSWLLAPLLVVSSVATAQMAPDTPHVVSPLESEPDVNGVDLLNGRKNIDMPVVLSTPADPHLRFDKVQNSAPYITGSSSGCVDCGLIQTFSVHIGAGTSESFRCTDADCLSVTYSGSRLWVPPHNYQRTQSGETYHFNVVMTDTVAGNSHYYQNYAATVNYPDGETLSYTYDTGSLPGDTFGRMFRRTTRISSTTGYYITISYQYTGGDVSVAGWGTPAQAALYDPSGTLIRRLVYSSDGGTITDYGNNVSNSGGRVFTTTIANELGADLEQNSGSVQLPGEGSAQLTITPTLLNNQNLITNVTRDSVAWNYAYDNPRLYTAFINQVGYATLQYDNVVVSGPNGYNVTYQMVPESGFGGENPYHNLVKNRTDALGHTTAYSYGIGDRLEGITLPEGNSVGLTYDDCGNIISKVNTPKAGSGLSQTTESAVFPDSGVPENPCPNVTYYRPTSFTDVLGRVTNYTYNSAGQMTQELAPADSSGVRRETDITYTVSTGGLSRKTLVRVCGATTSCSGNAESRTEYTYLGETFLPLTVTQKDEATGTTETTTYTYDVAGRVTSIDGPLAGTNDAKYFRYDSFGRKTWEIGAADANGLRIARRFTYRNSDDKVTLVETGTIPDPNNTNLTLLEQTATTYDSRRYPIREATSSGGTNYRVTDRSFLDRGLTDCTTVRMNLAALPAATATGACSLGTAGTQGADRITRNSYDNAGQPTKVQKAYGTALQQDYVTYAYTANGKQQFITDANGNKAQYTWDGFDRLSKWSFPSPTTPGAVSATDYEQYGYDAAGNRTSLRKRDASTLTYTYDNLNRMTVKAVPSRADLTSNQTRDVYYVYDILGRQLTAKFDSSGGADGVTNVYDGFGNVTSSTISMSGFTKALTSLYDLDNNRTRVTHPDTQAFRYDYDARDRLTDLYQGTGTTTKLDHFTYNNDGTLGARGEGNTSASAAGYSYDAIGRLTGQSDRFSTTADNVAWTFTLNPASQIVTETRDNNNYAYGDLANTNRAYTVNGLNQYTNVGGTTQSFDANGNLTADGSNTYTYDIENRLVKAVGGGKTTNLIYDPLGRLFQVDQGTAGTTQKFVTDGDALVLEYNGNGTPTIIERYVHGSNAAADDPLVQYDGSNLNTEKSLHADHLGSIVALADSGGGHADRNAYDEYGNPDGGNKGRFQYTGQAWLPELNLYYYKARMYSPKLGRFMQVDPIGYTGGVNLYGYIDDDPENATDPSGLCLEDACVVEGIIGVTLAAEAICQATGACRAFARAVQSGIDHLRNRDNQLPVPYRLQPITLSQARSLPDVERARGGIVVYRVYGGLSGPNGRSWTTMDPRTNRNFRQILGLPKTNTGQFLARGVLTDFTGVRFGRASPLGPQPGGGPELEIPNPAEQVKFRQDEPFDLRNQQGDFGSLGGSIYGNRAQGTRIGCPPGETVC